MVGTIWGRSVCSVSVEVFACVEEVCTLFGGFAHVDQVNDRSVIFVIELDMLKVFSGSRILLLSGLFLLLFLLRLLLFGL